MTGCSRRAYGCRGYAFPKTICYFCGQRNWKESVVGVCARNLKRHIGKDDRRLCRHKRCKNLFKTLASTTSAAASSKRYNARAHIANKPIGSVSKIVRPFARVRDGAFFRNDGSSSNIEILFEQSFTCGSRILSNRRRFRSLTTPETFQIFAFGQRIISTFFCWLKVAVPFFFLLWLHMTTSFRIENE